MSHEPLACEKKILDFISRSMFKFESALLAQIMTCIDFEEIFGCVPLEGVCWSWFSKKLWEYNCPLLDIHSGSSYFCV